MGYHLVRASYSANIKERRDCSCALFNTSGKLIAQAEHIPVHLGAMGLSVKAALHAHKFKKNDIVILNDPFSGGTHLPDLTLVTAVFDKGRPLFYAACRAHLSDIGGTTPGSMGPSTDIYQEGFRIPPILLTSDILSLLLRNVRNPKEIEGDINAMIGACNHAARRLKNVILKYTANKLVRFSEHIIKYSKDIAFETIKRIPIGVYSFTDYLDNDGFSNKPIKIKVTIKRLRNRLEIDFSGSDKQAKGNINCPFAVTVSSILYVIRCLVKEEIPANEGLLESVKITAPEGTVVNALSPAAVCAGNVETSQRIVDCLFGALAKAIPETIPAASYGTMTNISFGSSKFSYYETIAGGTGARPTKRGEDAVHMHMTNTMNTPIEALENSYPLRIEKYHVRKNSGGRGKFNGGDGIVREYCFLDYVVFSCIADRHTFSPYGLGGKNGKRGGCFVNGKRASGRFQKTLKRGDLVLIETPGGGAFGFSK